MANTFMAALQYPGNTKDEDIKVKSNPRPSRPGFCQFYENLKSSLYLVLIDSRNALDYDQ